MQRPAVLDKLPLVRHLAQAPAVVPALGFAALLVAYGNAVSALPEDLRDDYNWAFTLANVIFMLLVLAWATRFAGLAAGDIGITRRRAVRGALFGLGIAAAVILPVILYFIFPVGVPGGSIDLEGLEDQSLGSLLLWALVLQPIGVSIFEETMFRGVLQALSVRAFAVVRGILFSAFAFVLWHLVINFRTIQDTNVGDSAALAALGQVASLFGLLLGGLFMSLLRYRTGSLAAPIAFHWLVVVAMTATLALAD